MDDRVAWYLLLTRTALESPTNLDVVQASRVLPYISAIGKNAEALAAVRNAGDRVTRWLSSGERRNADSVIFELLVAALYARNGYEVEFLPEGRDGGKTPDLRITKSGNARLVECKRLAMRSDYSRAEAARWRTMWRPLGQLLADRAQPILLDVKFHLPLEAYGDSYLVDRLSERLRHWGAAQGVVVHDDELTVSVVLADLARIRRELQTHRSKCGSSREIELVWGTYDPRCAMHISQTIAGERVAIDDDQLGPAMYWDSIDFVCGAEWHCTSQTALMRKARDVRKQLADATSQLVGSIPSSVHIGIETLDGDLVEGLRYERIKSTLRAFKTEGSALQHVYCHLLCPESPPDKLWDFAETTIAHTFGEEPQPLQDRFLIVPNANSHAGRAHWQSGHEPETSTDPS